MTKTVLLVEDNPGDVRLMREILIGSNDSIHLLVASDGVEGMALLRQEGPYVHATRPDLILLDLNLPKMDGREVLALIKQDASLKGIPINILTTSEADSDVERGYQLQANCYLKKPDDWVSFANLVKSVIDFWLHKAKLPGMGTKADDELPIPTLQKI
jgi:CheY-like chemotaxis protein